MIHIQDAEQVRRLLPSPLQRTPVRQSVCRDCHGTRRVQVNKTGIAGDFVSKRCKACGKGGKR